jgi:hypothetical protein
MHPLIGPLLINLVIFLRVLHFAVERQSTPPKHPEIMTAIIPHLA